MSYAFTVSESNTFTVTHARHLAAKVATDLRRMNRLYDQPAQQMIDNYEAEVTELLRHGYLETVTFGFKRNGAWIEPTLKYTAREMLYGGGDDDPGKIRPGADVQGATFYSYLTYSDAWLQLSSAAQEQFKSTLPFQRTGAPEPQVERGYFADDKTYSSGSRSLGRASVRSY